MGGPGSGRTPDVTNQLLKLAKAPAINVGTVENEVIFNNLSGVKEQVKHDLGGYNVGDILYVNSSRQLVTLPIGPAHSQLVVHGSGTRPIWDIPIGGISIGDSISAGTDGSVLFVGTGSVIAQDNANFFWDDSNDAFLLGGTDVTTANHVFYANGTAVINQNGNSVSWQLGTVAYIDMGSGLLGVNTQSPEQPFHTYGPLLLEGDPTPRFYFKSNDGNGLVFNRYTGQESYPIFFGESADSGHYHFRGSGKAYFEVQPNVTKINTGATFNTTDAHMVIDNPETSASDQTMIVFTNSDASAVRGGIRVDYLSNFNWAAAGNQGHQFYNSLDPSVPCLNVHQNGIYIHGGSGGLAGTTASARVHIVGGSTTLPALRFTSATAITTPVAGAVEFTTDDYFATITTSTARKRLLMADPSGGLTSGRVPFATTNGRLTDDSDMTFSTDTLTVTKVSAALNGTVGATTPAAGIFTSLQADTITNDTGLAAGVFNPTPYNVANLDSVSINSMSYIRVGNQVTCSGKITVNPTTPATLTQAGIELPIASNLAFDYQCAGAAAASGIAGQSGAIVGDPTNNRAELQFIAGDVTSQPMFYTFTYTII